MEKDLRLTISRKQTLVIFFIMALVMGISMDGSFIIGYLTMLASIVAVGTISYDEFDNGFAFLMTLPFERKTYVREKYLFSLILAAMAWFVGLILYCVGNIIRHSAVSPLDELPMLLSLLPALYLSAAIMIPLLLKYGSERSRVVLYIIFGIIAIVLFGAKSFFSGSSNIFAELTKILDSMNPTFVLFILTAICVLVAYISYLSSIQIMEKKEF